MPQAQGLLLKLLTVQQPHLWLTGLLLLQVYFALKTLQDQSLGAVLNTS